MFRDIDAAMNNLRDDTLRMALKHLYIKWGDYCDEGREKFASDMVALADARRIPSVCKPRRQHRQPSAGSNEIWKQTALF